MARLFDDGSSEYLTNANAPVSGTPSTFACWGRPDTLGLEQRLITVNDSNSSANVLSLLIDQGSNKVQVQHYDNGDASAFSNIAVTINTWQHYCGVFTSDASRTAYLDGGNIVTNSESQDAMSGLDVVDISALFWAGGRIQFWSGDIAEAAIWNVALTAAEVLILSKGYSPLFVHPQNLVAYWPLIRDLNDRVGGYTMVASGTTVAAHVPKIINPVPPFISFSSAAPPVGNAPTGVLYGPLHGPFSGPI